MGGFEVGGGGAAKVTNKRGLKPADAPTKLAKVPELGRERGNTSCR